MAGTRTNEVFYDNVVVTTENLVGEKNRGFYHILTALEFERTVSVGGTRRVFEEVLGHINDRPVLRRNTLVRQRVAEMATEIEIARLFAYRLAWMQGMRIAGNYEASALKVFATEVIPYVESAEN